jgi:hypothetical protein
MPAKSTAQLRAMYAAAEGKSTLGIPRAVGKEYVAATPKQAKLPAKVRPIAKRPPRSMHPGDVPLPRMHTSEHN